jgi:hypothetical protein
MFIYLDRTDTPLDTDFPSENPVATAMPSHMLYAYAVIIADLFGL